MSNVPEFDFTFSRHIRLRGWGTKGLVALFGLFVTVSILVWSSPKVLDGVTFVVSKVIGTH